MFALSIFAQAAQNGGGGGSGGDPLFMPILLIALLIPFYFVVLRPAQRQEKERKAMVAGVKKNDEVVTTGGIVGTVSHIKEKAVGDEDLIILRIDDKIKLPVLRSAVYRVLNKTDASTTDAAKEPEKETSGK
jgi:preprotein translocase subunit YajC